MSWLGVLKRCWHQNIFGEVEGGFAPLNFLKQQPLLSAPQWRIGIWGLWAVILLTGCASSAELQPVTLTPSPTATRQRATQTWFPPTATLQSTSVAIQTPFSEGLSDVKTLLLHDIFSSLENWQTLGLPAESGRFSLGKNELVLVLDGGRAPLSVVRSQPELNDFFAQLTASPSLCKGEDQYGMFFRAQSADSFYRFVLTCDGRARLERLQNGQVAFLMPLTSTPVVPPGAPAEVRLGVEALGKHLRLWVDDHLLFEVEDAAFQRGRLGVFVRASGDSAVTVSFSDLLIAVP